MAKKQRSSTTRGILALRAAHVPFVVHRYPYEARGGTLASSTALSVDEHIVIKTLVFEDEQRRPFIVLMHGDCQVSTKALARALQVKSTSPCTPAVAERHTGYRVGGTSPFGTRKPLPVYAQASILRLPQLFINAGSRGLLVSLAGADLASSLSPTSVDVALQRSGQQR